MNDDDENSKRLYNLSKEYNAKQIEDNNRFYDSDASSYYHSSDGEDITKRDDKNKYQLSDSEEEEENIAHKGVGKKNGDQVHEIIMEQM